MAHDDLLIWQNDRSLEPLREILNGRASNFKAVSFDFFDTLVYRLTPDPEKLFIEVGRRIESRGLFIVSCSPEEFYSIRIAAQESAAKRALACGQSPEISISAIYKELALVLKDTGRAMHLEKEVERDLCYVNPYMASLVRYVRNIGCRTAITSDTYLSSEDLGTILAQNGLDPALFDFVTASNEAGSTKRNDGRLFITALARLGLTGSEVLHIGDNFASDVEAASRHGITGYFYYQADAQQAEILKSEQTLSTGSKPVAISLDSLRRLSARKHASNESFVDGAFTFGPLLARFADWSLDLFSRKGVRKVLALMREGELLGELLRRAAAASSVPVEVVPCYVSRKSTGLASLHKRIDGASLAELFAGKPSLKIRDIMTILGISGEAELQLAPSTLSREIDSLELLVSVVKRIMTGQMLRDMVEQRAAESHALVLDYLTTLIGEEECIGLLDLGWSGSIQSNIARILRIGGRHVKTVGCYVCTTQKAGHLPLEGDEAHAFVNNLWTRGNLVLELPLLAPVGSTEGYARNGEGQIVPLLGSTRLSSSELDLKKCLLEGVLTFQENWLALKSRKGRDVLHKTALAEIDSRNASILLRLMDYPTKMEAIRLGSLHHEENYGCGFSRVLCDPESEKVFQSQGLAGLFQQMNCYWPQGIIARDAPRIISALSQNWTNPLSFGRFGGRAIFDGKPASLSDEEHRFLLQVLRDFTYNQIVFFSSGLDGDQEFLESLALHREQSNGSAKPLCNTRPGIRADGHRGGGEFPALIEIQNGGKRTESIRKSGYRAISGNPTDNKTLGKIRDCLLPDSPCLMIITEGLRENDILPVLLSLAPSFGFGSIIAASYGREDLSCLQNPCNNKAAIDQWYSQAGKQGGFEHLDASPYGNLLPLYWMILVKRQLPCRTNLEGGGINLRTGSP